MKQKTQSRPTTFNVGDRVLDLSDIEGVVIDSPYAPELIRVSFDGAGGNWRDLDPSKLRHAETQSEVTVNESRHTPGPWEMSGQILKKVGDKDLEIAFINEFASTPTEIGQANARLIAAAPDMLEALKEIVDLCSELSLKRVNGDLTVREDWLNDMILAKQKSKSIIAKATNSK